MDLWMELFQPFEFSETICTFVPTSNEYIILCSIPICREHVPIVGNSTLSVGNGAVNQTIIFPTVDSYLFLQPFASRNA